MVRIQHSNYTWCRQSADMGVVSTTLKCLQIKGCRENGVVGVGFHNSFFYIFFILLLILYLILYIFPFGIQNNYTSYTSMPEHQENQGFAGDERYILCCISAASAAQRCRGPPGEAGSHINTTRRT